MRNLFAAIVMLTVLTTFSIVSAYYQKKQFYPTVVYLTKHKPYFAVMFHISITILVDNYAIFRFSVLARQGY